MIQYYHIYFHTVRNIFKNYDFIPIQESESLLYAPVFILSSKEVDVAQKIIIMIIIILSYIALFLIGSNSAVMLLIIF